MPIMFIYEIMKKSSICLIDQKFLLPNHTKLECDSDDGRIERKEYTRFNVIPVSKLNFLAFSKLLGKESVFIKILITQVKWMRKKWFSYESTFGLIKYKYTLDKSAEFQVVDIRRQTRGRPLSLWSIIIPLSYAGLLAFNPLKKEELISISSLIEEDDFHRNLRTNNNTAEFVVVKNLISAENQSI